jgi:hypothetical protein
MGAMIAGGQALGQFGPPHLLYADAGVVHTSPSGRKNLSLVNASGDMTSRRSSSGLSDTSCLLR